MARNLRPLAFALAIGLSSPVAMSTQRFQVEDIGQALSEIDVDALIGEAGGVLMRAPDASLDSLFQAVHASAQIPAEAQTMCRLLEPDADRSLEAIGRAANRLGPASRDRFVAAIAEIATAGMQSPPQPYDPAAARQTLKQAGVTATLLHDGFLAGLSATGNDRASRDARCRSMGWMLDALKDFPLPQRAAATRLLLNEGLALLASSR